MKMAYGKLFGCDDTYAAVSEISGIEAEPEKADVDFANSVVDGIDEHREEIDRIIGEAAIGWSVDRMPKVDLSILRIAVYELVFDRKAPQKVVINEAVRIAGKYGGEDSPKFINGVLGKIAAAEEK